jgi:beta-mannosidase
VAEATLLDGDWEMAEGTADAADWSAAIPATVPSSVHGALEKAGRIPDPKHGRNDAIANQQSFKTWWLRRRFARPKGDDHRLVFDGVALHCTVWLNGERLGEHEGMFGGPFFNVGHLLRDQNELVVKIDPAPLSGQPFPGENAGWKQTVCFNNVYGWHYSNIPALGIWRSVRLETAPTVKFAATPFVATENLDGRIRIVIDLVGPDTGFSGKITAIICPENFQGQPLSLELPVETTHARHRVRIASKIPDARPWWPNGYGEQALYQLTVQFTPHANGVADRRQTIFGIRTIEMAPLPPGKHPQFYNWTFVINGRPMFIKGTGWCTMDSSMDFSRGRYERFLKLAMDENCQMVRAWGSGMPETDDFYDLCDRLGIMVMQEWPTGANSHEVQPYAALEETVRLNTLRLRNHPSLAMWGGGNESDDPFGAAIDMMGRYAIELDGTRPFHRAEPWGGSSHNYRCWWSKAHLDYNLTLTSVFFGEFGIASLPVCESVQRYLPQGETNAWPPPAGGSFEHHTPVFNTADDMARLRQYSGYVSEGKTMQRFITGSQIAQCVALRHTLERARTRWPDCTGSLLYKLNDNYPAVSWSTVDWYGACKLAHWFVQDAFAPVHACVLFDRLDYRAMDVAWPVFLLDDMQHLAGKSWRLHVRAYSEQLQLIKATAFAGNGSEGTVRHLGQFMLTADESHSTPLLIVAEVICGCVLVDRTFYWLNFEGRKDCLFELPPTTLALETAPGVAMVRNTGSVPALAVMLERHGHLDTFRASDNCFWLEAGESKQVAVNQVGDLVVNAWNTNERREALPMS